MAERRRPVGVFCGPGGTLLWICKISLTLPWASACRQSWFASKQTNETGKKPPAPRQIPPEPAAITRAFQRSSLLHSSCRGRCGFSYRARARLASGVARLPPGTRSGVGGHGSSRGRGWHGHPQPFRCLHRLVPPPNSAAVRPSKFRPAQPFSDQRQRGWHARRALIR